MARPVPSGWSGVGLPLASFKPHSRSAWLPQSAYEWIASASIEEEPVNTAPAVLARAIAKLAARAKTIDLTESAWADMACGFSAKGGRPRARRVPAGIRRRARPPAPARYGTG